MSNQIATRLSGLYVHPSRDRGYDLKDLWVRASPQAYDAAAARERDQNENKITQNEKIEAAALKALEDHLARVIDDPLELNRAQEMVNGLCAAYIGEADDEEQDLGKVNKEELANETGKTRGRMGLDARPGSSALTKIFRDCPPPRQAEGVR
jgi:hypothetical protein